MFTADQLRYRRARRSDAAVVAAMHAASWRRHYRGAYSDSFLDGDVAADRLAVWSDTIRETQPNHCTIVAEVAEDLVGFIHTVLDHDSRWGSFVENLHVAPASKRRGIGTELLAQTARILVSRGEDPGLYLWVLHRNGAAQAFYEARGAQCVEVNWLHRQVVTQPDSSAHRGSSDTSGGTHPHSCNRRLETPARTAGARRCQAPRCRHRDRDAVRSSTRGRAYVSARNMRGAPDPREGRRLYGQDPEIYARGRPQYPERVYDLLRARCGLSASSQVVEIGPGTGLVTRRLLDAGARVTAIEPNVAMARYLNRVLADARLDVIVAAFEDTALPSAAYDLAVAATSFHWVSQPEGMAALRRVVRRGGWVAIWWTLFEDPRAPDDLSRLVETLAGPLPVLDPSAPPFQLDEPARRADLTGAGFADVDSEVVHSTCELDAPAARALYASMAVILHQPPEEQARVLDAIEAAVRDRLANRVERELVTAIYTARP